MSEHPADSGENRLRATVAGALTFVSFGLVAALVLWIADYKTGAQATEAGQFSPEQIQLHESNLKEIEEAQGTIYDQSKVEESIRNFSGKKPKATKTVVPGSETDLKNMAANAAKAEAEKSTDEDDGEEAEVVDDEKPKGGRRAKGKGAKAATKEDAGRKAE